MTPRRPPVLVVVACAVVVLALLAPAVLPRGHRTDLLPIDGGETVLREAPAPRPASPPIAAADRPGPTDGRGTRAALRRLLVARGVPARGAKRLAHDAEWGAFPVRRTGPGRSRIGGPPVLPRGTRWPVRKGRPLSFVALIDLAELPQFPGRRRLPATGTLTFFAALERLFEPESGNRPGRRLRVLYRPARVPLEDATKPRPTRRPPPDVGIEDATVPSVAVGFRPRLTLVDSLFLADAPRYRLGEAGERAYERTIPEWNRRSGVPSYDERGSELAEHAVLGIPTTAQDDPREPGQLTLLTLLPDTVGGSFLDGGSVSFLIDAQDLKARRWSRIEVYPDSG
ncbi:DUF1963 domain-containing protein [Patulibacter minatonensis]|uniref:DUF1963 domain-containing protein n=1 Tax=Patulibacter minatonensis TaxID=298163 RepID=UPI00047CE944|nr:DUF1963 domain-containing protein [Patulibacter minatonensis]